MPKRAIKYNRIADPKGCVAVINPKTDRAVKVDSTTGQKVLREAFRRQAKVEQEAEMKKEKRQRRKARREARGIVQQTGFSRAVETLEVDRLRSVIRGMTEGVDDIEALKKRGRRGDDVQLLSRKRQDELDKQLGKMYDPTPILYSSGRKRLSFSFAPQIPL
jgi:hypothetical protein